MHHLIVQRVQCFRSVVQKGIMPFGMVPFLFFFARCTGGGDGTLAQFFLTLLFLFVFIRYVYKKYII